MPAMLPVVEIANVRPAVRPTLGSARTCSRTATGPTADSRTLAGPNRITAHRTGSSRGPGSQRSTHSIDGVSKSGIERTASAPAPTTAASANGDG